MQEHGFSTMLAIPVFLNVVARKRALGPRNQKPAGLRLNAHAKQQCLRPMGEQVKSSPSRQHTTRWESWRVDQCSDAACQTMTWSNLKSMEIEVNANTLLVRHCLPEEGDWQLTCRQSMTTEDIGSGSLSDINGSAGFGFVQPVGRLTGGCSGRQLELRCEGIRMLGAHVT